MGKKRLGNQKKIVILYPMNKALFEVSEKS